jgi:hypothetical protein
MQTRSASNSPPLSSADVIVNPTRTKAYWTQEDEAALIAFLAGKKDELGSTAFKQPIFNEAAQELNANRTKGGEKTGSSCLTKWTRVRFLLYVYYMSPYSYD